MKLLSCLATFLALLASTARLNSQTFVDDSTSGISPGDAKQVVDSFLLVLNDPLSAQLARVKKGAQPDTYCGIVNAKNSYGAYIGFRDFAVNLKSKALTIVPERDLSENSAQRITIMKICDGKDPPKPRPTIIGASSAPYRAALLVQQKSSTDHKSYLGTVVWRLDRIDGGPGKPMESALRADINLPAANVKVSMQMQRNTDPTLSASHTIVLGFVLAPGAAFMGVRSILMPQMRSESSPNGEALQGIGIVPITPTYYLVGLRRGEQSSAHNLKLMSSREWIDLQLVLNDGRVAKLTFEKGAQSQKDVSDAISAWK